MRNCYKTKRNWKTWKHSDVSVHRIHSVFLYRGMETRGRCKKMTNVSEYTLNLVPTIVIIYGLVAQLIPFAHAAAYPLDAVLNSKRIAFPSVTDVSSDDGYPDYQSGVRYDEYPIVVPKRAALILDRILKEIESAKDSNQLINDWSPISRRGNNKDKLYFRCYFNAVSCYRRK